MSIVGKCITAIVSQTLVEDQYQDLSSQQGQCTVAQFFAVCWKIKYQCIVEDLKFSDAR